MSLLLLFPSQSGTTYHQTAAVTVTTTDTLTRQVKATKTATAPTASHLTRGVAARRVTTATATSKVTRQVSAVRTANVTTTATRAAVQYLARTLVVAVHVATTTRRSLARTLAAAAHLAAAVRRTTNRTLTSAAHAATTFTSSRVLLRTLTATVSAAPALRRQVGKRAQATVTAVRNLHRTAIKHLQATATTTPGHHTGRSRIFTVAVHILATLGFATPAAGRDLVVTFGPPLGSRWTIGQPAGKWTIGVLRMLTQSVLTLEYVRVPVSAVAAGQPVNPTTDTVQMAFVAPGVNPTSGDWKTATWDTNAPNGVYTAQCLVGPSGTIQLPAGVYSVWVKVVDSPEVPVRQVGQIQIT